MLTSIKRERINQKRHKYWKEVKLSLFVDSMILYREKATGSAKKSTQANK